ncbi:MAG: KOW domain-containing RNA-binding protein [Firmicutes bacterium]|nr:KOW domain-containing RNA-binding protein [Bacillota bacterium]
MKKKKYPDYGAFVTAVASSYGGEWQGRLVRSKAGHDKGHFYLVLACAGNILYLADGRRRGVANPKKKNISHVQIVHKVAADFVKDEGLTLPSDLDIRAAVSKLIKESE